MVPRTVLNRPTWFYKKDEAGGGVVEDMMAHFFDLLRTLVGPIEAVYAVPGSPGRSAVSRTARRSASRSRIWPASASASPTARSATALRRGCAASTRRCRRFRSTARTAACTSRLSRRLEPDAGADAAVPLRRPRAARPTRSTIGSRSRSSRAIRSSCSCSCSWRGSPSAGRRQACRHGRTPSPTSG